ncbi:MAG: CheR family methyltransferase [Syntrophothermus sp.]
MHLELSYPEFEQISRYVSRHLGLNFGPDRQPDLERGLKAAGHSLGFHDLHGFVSQLLNTPSLPDYINALAVNMTIGETYFFRENRIFEVLRSILPQMIEKKGSLRIWSAGCCSGEEPYSVAMLIREIFPDSRHSSVSILGTDLNPVFLKKACDAVYSDWSFRNVPDAVKKKYFRSTQNHRYSLIDEIKKMVKFRQLNLMEDPFPSAVNDTAGMDIIFCRNVLIYFNEEGIKNAVEKFSGSLNEGGWFIPSMSELAQVKRPELKGILFDDVIIYNKISSVNGSGTAFSYTLKENTPAALPEKNYILKHPAEDKRPAMKLRTSQTKPDETIKKIPDGSFEKAKILFNSGDYLMASSQLELLFEKNLLTKKQQEECCLLLARCSANTGDIQQAMKWCRLGLEFNKLNPKLYMLMCNLYQEEQKEDEAVNMAGKALFLDPDYLTAHFTLANIFRRSGKGAEAEKHLAICRKILNRMKDTDSIEGTEGITAGGLRSIVDSLFQQSKQ